MGTHSPDGLLLTVGSTVAAASTSRCAARPSTLPSSIRPTASEASTAARCPCRANITAAAKPDDFALFDRWREQERERLGRNKPDAAGVLAWFDSRPKFLEDLARFFDTDIEPFEKWRRGKIAQQTVVTR
jgi:hypothetical protein